MTQPQEQGASAARTAGEDLNDRLRAAGMFTIPEMMGETPLTRWQTHTAMTSLDAFEWWLDAQVSQYLTMKAEYEIGDKPKDDELYEWVLAHSGAFHVIRTNFRAAKAATPAPSSPGVPDSVRTLSEAESSFASGVLWGQRNTAYGVGTNPAIQAGRSHADAVARRLDRTLISAHPAGQSTGQGADEREALRRTCRLCYDRGEEAVCDGCRPFVPEPEPAPPASSGQESAQGTAAAQVAAGIMEDPCDCLMGDCKKRRWRCAEDVKQERRKSSSFCGEG